MTTVIYLNTNSLILAISRHSHFDDRFGPLDINMQHFFAIRNCMLLEQLFFGNISVLKIN